MTTSLTTQLPQEKMPYLLRRGEGKRYLFGNQVATIIADAASTGNMLSAVVIGGAKGESFPLHTHTAAYESVYVLEGRVQFLIGSDSYLLVEGDYAHIAPGTAHAYRLLGHRNRFISYSIGGDLTAIYPVLGQAHDPIEYLPISTHQVTEQQRQLAERHADIAFAKEETVFPEQYELACNQELPTSASSYVLESGEGVRLLTGDQIHRLLATRETTNGEYIVVASDGPKGDEIVSHYHEHHTETFFCTQGHMTMWANEQELQLFPGDFLHVPAGTVHSYRLEDHFTKVVGVLASGLFEPFFRLLGDEYAHYMFPAEPGAVRIDRLMENMDQLDLNIVGPPNSHSKQA
ncbi:quercetin 2,3-dioxygenase [Paenibacillus hunanensis]|uniref:quercetin 2,3-dioxygenase n=1 Tax=Paenibacillus hunanensis TaxID=539262 RepID=UPI002A6B78C0|nr:quercetin 2,3-dioxygenase [Paenibacillus hunanensis]WPP39439.1 quercetin 2,3-dioxygenase [Paenibacillus hunanensis]